MAAWRPYHELTKHTPERLRASSPVLDWANMPNLFREYEGVPVLDLPADPPEPSTPALAVLQGAPGLPTAADGPTLLSQLLFYSAANSATKQTPAGRRYALRVNPSSGNLHPTEFHFTAGGMPQWPDGCYHYRASSHMADQRAAGATHPGLHVTLTTIAWREAWKYGNRAYRYCLLDAGHAAEALRLAAFACGCRATVEANFDDHAITFALNLPDEEWPLLRVAINPPFQQPLAQPQPGRPQGIPTALSAAPQRYEDIDAIHAVTSAPGAGEWPWPVPGASAPATSTAGPAFGSVARTRRSALDFQGGDNRLTAAQLSLLLRMTAAASIRLYVFIHRVEGMAPGVYLYHPQAGELEPLRSGDQRVAVAGLCLRQDLAANACIALSLVADLETLTATHGARAYRYSHFEAGAIGQRLYLAATALGLGATGIGGFFDDATHNYLGLAAGQGQVVYHFAIGFPIRDPRLTP